MPASDLQRIFEALAALGYRPKAPVSATEFGDVTARQRLVDDKSLRVLSFASPTAPLTEVDLFAEAPLPFAEAYGRVLWVDIGYGGIPVVSAEDLIAMKRRVARPKDQEDIDALEALKRGSKG